MADFTPEGFEEFTTPTKGNRPLNNPGGLRPVGASTGFMMFPNTEAGRAALEADLAAKGKKGFSSVSDLIKVWAPKADKNDTDAYIAAVTKHVGGDKIDLKDPAILKKVADAIQKQEGVVPLKEQATVAGVGVPQVGGGRGGQGGPTAEQAAQRTSTTAPMPAQQESGVGGAAGAFLENIGRTASFGATDYANAAINSKIYGIPFDQALADVRARNQAIDVENPMASTAGKITGTVAGGTVAGGGATKLAQLATRIANLGKTGAIAADIGTQALVGGGTSATEEALTNPEATAESILKAGTIGAVTSGAGAGASQAVEGATSRFVGKRVKDINAQRLEKVEEMNAKIAAENVKRAAASKAAQQEATAANRAAEKQWLESIPESGPVPPRPAPVAPKPTLTQAELIQPGEVNLTGVDEYRNFMREFKKEPTVSIREAEFPSTAGALASGAKRDIVSTVKENIVPIGMSGALGLGGYLLGDENDPLQRGLQAGAGVIAGLKGKAAYNAMARYNLMHPGAIGTGLKATGQSLGLGASRYAQPEPLPVVEQPAEFIPEGFEPQS